MDNSRIFGFGSRGGGKQASLIASIIAMDEATRFSVPDLQRMQLMQRERMEYDRSYRTSWYEPPDWSFPTQDDEPLKNAPATEPDRKAIGRLAVALADDEGENALALEAEALLGYSVLRQKLKIPGKLGEALALLDSAPLDSVAVEKYKAEMVLFRKKELLDRMTRTEGRYGWNVAWRRVTLEACGAAGTEIPLFVLRKALQVKKACPEVTLEVDELIEEKVLIDPFLVARLADETYYLEVWKEPKFEETL